MSEYNFNKLFFTRYQLYRKIYVILVLYSMPPTFESENC